MPMWEGEDDGPEKPDTTPKQRLLGWIQSKVPDRPVKNFTSDWNDGKLIGALVDAVAPGEWRRNYLICCGNSLVDGKRNCCKVGS